MEYMRAKLSSAHIFENMLFMGTVMVTVQRTVSGNNTVLFNV